MITAGNAAAGCVGESADGDVTGFEAVGAGKTAAGGGFFSGVGVGTGFVSGGTGWETPAAGFADDFADFPDVAQPGKNERAPALAVIIMRRNKTRKTFIATREETKIVMREANL
jgi:hypothetical protein